MSNTDRISFTALKVRQPIGDFFIASLPADLLVEIAYSDVRRLADEERDVERYLGIQRPINSKRVKEIRSYLGSPDATFPTGVIVAVDEKGASYDEVTKTMTLESYIDDHDGDLFGSRVPLRKIAKILDGQHRLAAYLNDNKQFAYDINQKPFDINVAIFIGADIAEQASIFATVNLAQTKVNRSLVYDLTELSEVYDPYRVCHNTAVALDTLEGSPFYKRIKRLGVRTPGRDFEPLTQASFVEALVRFISPNPSEDRNRLMDGKKLGSLPRYDPRKYPFRELYLSGDFDAISEIIYNYFSAVRKRWPASWDAYEVKGNLLPRSNAFKALMRYLRDDVYYSEVYEEDDAEEVPSTKAFEKYFRAIAIRDEDFTTKNFVPGSGGEAKFYRLLRGDIEAEDLFE